MTEEDFKDIRSRSARSSTINRKLMRTIDR